MKTHLLLISLLAGSLGIAPCATARQPSDAPPPPGGQQEPAGPGGELGAGPGTGPGTEQGTGPGSGPGSGPGPGRRGQPGERPGERGGGALRRFERDPALLKAAVDRLLERSSQFNERLQSIKTKLDAGSPIVEIRDEFEQALRSLGEGMNQLGFGPRGGMRGGDGPDDRPEGPGPGPGARGGDGPDGMGGPPPAPLGGRNGARGLGGPAGFGGPGGPGAPGAPVGVGGVGGVGQKLTPEERTRIEAAMRTHAPSAFAELEAVRAKNPSAADRMFDRLRPRLRPVIEHKEKAGPDYEAKKADLESFVAVMRAGRVLAEERTGANRPEVVEQLRGQLRSALAQQVDIRLKMQEEQLAELTRRAQKLRDEIERNRANKDKFVEDRVKETMEAGKREGAKK